jgi:prefoldin subunit 5
MIKDYEEIIEEIDRIKLRLDNVEKTVAEIKSSKGSLDSEENRISQIIKRAKIRAVEMSNRMTIDEVWEYYDKSVAALKEEIENRGNNNG